MKKQQKNILIGIGLVVLLVVLFKFPFGISDPNTTSYSTVGYTQNTITYSNVEKTYNSGMALSTHAFSPYAGGNIDYFIPFYRNLGLLPFYINNVLKGLSIADFNILPGDGDKAVVGCHLSIPNYCTSKPSGYTEDAGIDASACPHWRTYTTPVTCKCFQLNKVCNAPFSGATEVTSNIGAYSGWSDCSSKVLDNSNYGGSAVPGKITNYKSILDADGWIYNPQYSCYVKSRPSDDRFDTLARSMYCKVSGSDTSGKPYTYYGDSVTWGQGNGFICNNVGTKSEKIDSGIVLFSFDAPPAPVVQQPVQTQPISEPVQPQPSPQQVTTPYSPSQPTQIAPTTPSSPTTPIPSPNNTYLIVAGVLMGIGIIVTIIFVLRRKR